MIHLDPTKNLVVMKFQWGKLWKGETRTIKADKWWINRNTPVGEDAEIWERKPYGELNQIWREHIVACGDNQQ